MVLLLLVSGCPGNLPPVALFDVGGDSRAGEGVALDASASFDPDGQIVEYRWDFGDGSTGEGETVSHVYDASGEYTVTLSVTDDRRGSDEATLKLQIGPPLFELKVSIEPEIGGEVILDPPGGKYEAGTPVMLAAEAAEGFCSPAMRATKEARMPN